MKSSLSQLGTLVFTHRHDIADTLMVVAAILRFWPDNGEIPSLTTPPKRKRQPRKFPKSEPQLFNI